MSPLIYYSIADFGDSRYERQWCQSIRSLRTYNERVPVHLVVYNGASDSILHEAERHRVTVHAAGNYGSRLRDSFPQHGEALSRHPILHKVLSLQFVPTDGARQILYLDCDTFFFSDVLALFEKYRDHHFYGREEPLSRRSHYGYQPTYLNEDVLAETYAAEGLGFIPPYNMGVFLLNGGVPIRLAEASGKLLRYAWRLLLDMSENQPVVEKCDPVLLFDVRRRLKTADLPPLRYPSSNCWILDEIAMLFTLAGIPALTHSALSREDVAQNGEYAQRTASLRPTLVHYYSGFEQAFFAQVKRW